MTCPQCNEQCDRDEVDIGVGTMCGPWRCNYCGWYDGHEVDAMIDSDRDAIADLNADDLEDFPDPEVLPVRQSQGKPK